MRKRIYTPMVITINAAILCGLLIAPVIGSKFVTTVAEKAPLSQRRCFVIDAGHGGVDGGTTSCTGVLESKINLDIALCLNDLLHLLGMDTVMIRTTDVSVYTQGATIAAQKVSDLKQRVKIVNSTENAVLISIHQNHFSDSRYSGAQVFYSHTPDSEKLAKEMQSFLLSVLNPGSNRKAKKADGVYLMENIQRPGILIECGFLSNYAEEEKLRTPDYQKQLCCTIAAVASKFTFNSTIT